MKKETENRKILKFIWNFLGFAQVWETEPVTNEERNAANEKEKLRRTKFTRWLGGAKKTRFLCGN